MKKIATILLVLITSFYVLPVKNLFIEKDNIAVSAIDTEKEQVAKKEKNKELFYLANANFATKHILFAISYQNFITISTTSLRVDTPPPDSI